MRDVLGKWEPLSSLLWIKKGVQRVKDGRVCTVIYEAGVGEHVASGVLDRSLGPFRLFLPLPEPPPWLLQLPPLDYF